MSDDENAGPKPGPSGQVSQSRREQYIGIPGEFDEQEDWESYVARVKLFWRVNKVAEEDKTDQFLLFVGRNAFEKLTTLCAPAEPEEKSLQELIALLGRYYKPKPSIMAERFKFYNRKQMANESVAEYEAELRRLAKTCEFTASIDAELTPLLQSLRDQFVFGLNNEAWQRRLLQEPGVLTFTRAVEITKAAEAAQKNAQQFNIFRGSSEVHRVMPKSKGNKPQNEGTKGKQHFSNSKKFVKCFNCGKEGHYARDCRASRKAPRVPRKSSHSQIKHVSEETVDFETLSVSPKETNHVAENLKPCPKVEAKVNGKPVTLEIDTGSVVTLINEVTWRDFLEAPILRSSSLELKSYSHQKIPLLGEFDANVEINGQVTTFCARVVKGNARNLLGRDLLSQIRLDWQSIFAVFVPKEKQLQAVLDEFNQIFLKELGLCKGVKAKINMKSEAIPIFRKARALPFAMKKRVESELDRLEQLGIIKPVQYSDWAAPVVPVLKRNGSVRLCGDFSVTINPKMEIAQYPLPQPNELFTNLNGGVMFSKLDFSEAYLQIELEKESQKLVVINTHKGLFQYTRLPFGISSAPAIFQQVMDQIFQGLTGVQCYLDDIIITGKSEEDHMKNLRAVLERIKEHGLRLCKEKCTFFQESIEYLGHIISRQGLHPSKKKVEAIQKIAEPTNVTELKSFLGMVVYFAKFLPQLSERAAPLNELLKKGTPWMWNSAKSAAFNGLKEDLMSMPVLMHFNPKLPLGLACDASSSGIGAVLFHILPNGDERPIAYASKSLTPAERNYSQIEKEGLSIVFGVKKFHQYLWGHTFKLVTDHKPLVTIFGSKKGIPTIIASRLQRWSIILSAYTYEIVYKSTAKHGNADGLSRLSCGFDPHFESGHALVDLIEYEVFGTLPVSVDVVKDASKRDAVFSRVIDDICNGRKLSRNSSFEDGEIIVFCRREAELTVCDGILIWGSRVVVPKELRGRLLNELHAVHSGIVRMKSLAREHFWWPGMDGEIENIARSCCACQENGNNLQKVPLHPWQLPERPWERLHIDLAGPYFGFMWLVVEDAFSKWPEIIKLRTATSATVATNLMKIFAVQGLPEQLVSDNGSQFTSVEFKEFCKYRGISNCYVTPYHPQANGQVERFIQTFKKCMNKMAQSGNNLDYNLNNFLLTYRITKHSSTNEAPCQLLMGRKLRTRFDLIHPREKDVIDNKTAIVQDRVRKSQEKGKYYHDRTAKMREFEVGDHVWARNYSKRGPQFVRAKIHHKISPLSYKVFVREGLIWRRHSQQLKARFKRGQSLYREDDDIPIASSEQPHDCFSCGFAYAVFFDKYITR